MSDPHLTSVRAGIRSNAELAKLVAQLGTRRNPRGAVLRAYRVARAALDGQIDNVQAVAEAMEVLRLEVNRAVTEKVEDAFDIGVRRAGKELNAYNLPSPQTRGRFQVVAGAVGAVMAVYGAQQNTVLALALSGQGQNAILGDQTRVGVLNPATVIREAARWLSTTSETAWSNQVAVASQHSSIEFKRQAVAAIPTRTTDTCLRVHGQVVGMDEEFTLTGTPRYARRLMRPPFHDYCRTSTVLIRAEDQDDALTQEMVDAARAELRAREIEDRRAGVRPEHATARRTN